jgi:pilus assembly protein Flp/PilA
MSGVALKLKELLIQEDGPTATEYAVMLALIVVIALAAIGSLGESVNAVFTDLDNEVSGVGG